MLIRLGEFILGLNISKKKKKTLSLHSFILFQDNSNEEFIYPKKNSSVHMETERERKRGKATFEIKQSKYIACFSLYLLYILSDDNNVQMVS